MCVGPPSAAATASAACAHARTPCTRARARADPVLLHACQIFNRAGACLYCREWSRPVPPTDQRQDNKLMFGFLFSLKQLVQKMSPKKRAPPGGRRRSPCTLSPRSARPFSSRRRSR